MRRVGCVALLALVVCAGCGDGGGARKDPGDAAVRDGADAADTASMDVVVIGSTDAASMDADTASPDAADRGAPDMTSVDVPVAMSAPWSDPVAVDNIPAGNATGPVAIGKDAAGNAIAVWRQSNAQGGIFSIEANRFDKARGSWGLPITLEADEIYSALDPDLAVDRAGNAVVIWNQVSGGFESVWSNWYDAAAGTWHGPALVEIDDTGVAQGARVASLPGGGAVAVWFQWDGLRQSVWTNRLSGGKWTGRVLLETTDSEHAFDPRVATDPNGNAVAVWTQTDEHASVWSSTRVVNADRWGAPRRLGDLGEVDNVRTPAPHVALDATGNGFAIWALRAGGTWSIWASRYHGGTDAWDAAVLVEGDDLGHATGPVLAVDANGDAFAAWRQSDGQTLGVVANHFDARLGAWTGTWRLGEVENLEDTPVVSAAGDGQAVVVWRNIPSITGEIYASRFDPRARAWAEAGWLEGDPSTGVPRVAIDAAGDAIALWPQRQGDWLDLMASYQPK